jgi:dTDP-4-dehydrorhamnose reductase
VSGWLVTGAAGQLGSDVVDVLHAYGEEVAVFDREALDVTNDAARTGLVSGRASRPRRSVIRSLQ